jgi:hypothetical protein
MYPAARWVPTSGQRRSDDEKEKLHAIGFAWLHHTDRCHLDLQFVVG